MLLAVDIGNSAIKFCLFEGDLTLKFSVPTKRDATPGDIERAVDNRLPTPVSAAIVCSVVPDVDPAVRTFLRDATGVEPTFVRNTFDFGLRINYEPLDSLGT